MRGWLRGKRLIRREIQFYDFCEREIRAAEWVLRTGYDVLRMPETTALRSLTSDGIRAIVVWMNPSADPAGPASTPAGDFLAVHDPDQVPHVTQQLLTAILGPP
jgi:hypothetical protein